MVTTSPDNLWSPNATDPYNLTTDLATMQTSVQAALSNRPRTYRTDLTDAQRIALSGADLVEGLRVRTTDTRTDWLYTGGVWLSTDPGVYLLTPTSVSGGTITGGKTVLSAGDSVTINGVFSTRFRKYRVLCNWTNSGGNNRGLLRLTSSGSPATSGYTLQNLVANGSSVTGAFGGSLGYWPAVENVGDRHFSDITLVSPGHPDVTSMSGNSSTLPAGISFGGGSHGIATPYDGLRLELETKGGRAFTSGEISVYGLA